MNTAGMLKLSEADLATAQNMNAQGMSLNEIGRALKVSPYIVKRELVAAGVPTPGRRPRQWSEEDLQRLAKMHINGSAISTIAGKYHTNPETVRVLIQEQGVEIRPARRGAQRSEDEIRTVVSEYNAGVGLKKLAASLGVCKTTIRRILEAGGVEFEEAPWPADPTPEEIEKRAAECIAARAVNGMRVMHDARENTPGIRQFSTHISGRIGTMSMELVG